MSCQDCPGGVRVCGPNGPPPCPPPDIFLVAPAVKPCPDGWCWICKFQQEGEPGWTSVWISTVHVGVYVFAPYKGWHDNCACG
jgi:hypothetical protein